MELVINGNFLTEPMAGVQRYAFEMTKRLDRIAGDLPLELAVPGVPTEQPLPAYSNIRVVRVGSRNGKKWEQTQLASYLRQKKAAGVHMCNTVPLSWTRGLVCVHDLCFKVHPEFFTEKGDWHEILFRRMMYRRACAGADRIVTGSQFARQEILQNYHLKNPDILVAYDGWQHYDREDMDETIFAQYPEIRKGQYFYYLASLAKNKNLPWILKQAEANPQQLFVLSGRPLGEAVPFAKYPNVLYTGFVTDGQARALMHSCRAFLFPSFYEGFGVPPLEALCMGAKLILSDIPCLREIYGDGAVYVDPHADGADLEKLLTVETAPAETVLQRYSWDASAEKMAAALREIAEKYGN